MAEQTPEQQRAFLARMSLLRGQGLSQEEARAQAIQELEGGATFGFRPDQQEELAFESISGREFNRNPARFTPIITRIPSPGLCGPEAEICILTASVAKATSQ